MVRGKTLLIVEDKSQIKAVMSYCNGLFVEDFVVAVCDFSLKVFFSIKGFSCIVLSEEYLKSQAVKEIDRLAFYFSDLWRYDDNGDFTVFEDISFGQVIKIRASFCLKASAEKTHSILAAVKEIKPVKIVFFSSNSINKQLKIILEKERKVIFRISIFSGIRNVFKDFYFALFVYVSQYFQWLTIKRKASRIKSQEAEIVLFYDKGHRVLEPVRLLMEKDKFCPKFEVLVAEDEKIKNQLKKQDFEYLFLDGFWKVDFLSFLRQVLWLERSWRKVKQSQCLYRGVDILRENEHLRSLWKKDVFSYLQYFNAFKNYLSSRNVKVLVFSQDVWPLSKLLALMANHFKLKTAVILHGVILDTEFYKNAFLPLTAKKIAVCNKDDEEYFMRNGVSEDRIEITGFPPYDKFLTPNFKFTRGEFCSEYEIEQSKKIIVFAVQNFSESKLKKIFEIIAGSCLEFPEVFLVVKLRPMKGGVDFYINIIRENNWNMDRIVFVDDLDMSSLVGVADIFSTGHSTTHIEAALAQKDMILIDLENNPELPVVRCGGALKVVNKTNYTQALRNILKDKKTRANLKIGRDKFIREYLFDNDGQSAKRVIDFIKRLAEG